MSTNTEPKIFFESKIKAALYGSIVFIPLLAIIVSETVFNPAEPLYAKSLAMFALPFLVLFVIFFIAYPPSTLELYDDRFVYRKGRRVFGASWPDVTLIAFQSSRRGIPRSFVIRTNDKSTKLISTNLLRLKNSSDHGLNLVDFVTDLESISGKKVKWGDTSVDRFSEVGFLELLKGERMSGARKG